MIKCRLKLGILSFENFKKKKKRVLPVYIGIGRELIEEENDLHEGNLFIRSD